MGSVGPFLTPSSLSCLPKRFRLSALARRPQERRTFTGCPSKAPIRRSPAAMAPPGRQPPALLPDMAAAGPVTLLASAGGCAPAVAAAIGQSVTLLSPDGTSTLLPPPPDSAGKPIACLAAAAAFVAAGERGSKPGLHVWKVADGSAAAEGTEIAHALHNFGIAALAFSPTGERLAGAGGWWGAETDPSRVQRRPTATLQHPPANRIPLPAHATGRLLASHGADKDWQLAVWSPATGRLLGKAREKGQQYDALAMPSDNTICGINRTALVGTGGAGAGCHVKLVDGLRGCEPAAAE